MFIIDDIKSLYSQLNYVDYHEQVAFNELVFGKQVGEKTYAFCPFCLQILEIDSCQIDGSSDDGRVRLKEPVDCNCRRGLRYICKGLLEKPLPESSYWGQRMKYMGFYAIIMLCAIIGFYAGIRYNEIVGIDNDIVAYFFLSLPFVMILAFIGMMITLLGPVKKHLARKGKLKETYDPFMTVREQLQRKGEPQKAESSRNNTENEKKQLTWRDEEQEHPAEENLTTETGQDSFEEFDDWLMARGGDD